MPLNIYGREIRRIHVIDDDPMVRDSYLETVADMGMIGVAVTEPISDVEALFAGIDLATDGIIFDYQLNSTKYSQCNGDTYGVAAYGKRIPFIISSHFQPLSMGGRRRFIPKAVHIDHLEPASVQEAFELCVQEYSGNFTIHRKPVRTLVRIEGLERIGASCKLNVVVPNWNPSTGIQIRIDSQSLPNLSELEEELHEAGEARLTAEVNTGATDLNELYFFNWKQL